MQFLSEEPISVRRLVEESEFPECGALCTFEGLVRNHHEGKSVSSLCYEAYVPMAEKELIDLVNEIQREWTMSHVRVVHRLGHLQIGDVAVAIAVWTPHRKEGFRACEAMIDRLKKRVPIWKREYYTDGKSEWVICTHHGDSESNDFYKENLIRPKHSHAHHTCHESLKS